jgi:hypothetical protein
VPVTPFHFGVGLFAKGLAPRHVSFRTFCATQIAIDCESGYFLLRGEWPAHRFFHTLLGASLLCAATVLVVGPTLPRLLHRLGLAERARRIPAHVLAVTALLGVLGHVVPDAIMHSDMHPFAPLTPANPLYEVLSLGPLHLLLVVMAVLGVLVLESRRHC